MGWGEAGAEPLYIFARRQNMLFDTALFFIQTVVITFICGICLSVYSAPTTACMEGHTFCAGCLNQLDAQPCPCRQAPLAAFALNRPLQSIIRSLGVRCMHHNAGVDRLIRQIATASTRDGRLLHRMRGPRHVSGRGASRTSRRTFARADSRRSTVGVAAAIDR